MKSPVICLYALLLLLLYVTMGFALNSGMSTTVLRYHNLARKRVYPAASNMQQLDYDEGLEASAQSVADRCDPGYQLGPDIHHGQAIAFAPRRTLIDGLHNVLITWFAGMGSLTYQWMYCDEPECPNYLQMIWARAAKVGCAYTRCDSLGGDETYLWVCHYDRRMESVQKKPYKSGAACSVCLSDQQCASRLCD